MASQENIQPSQEGEADVKIRMHCSGVPLALKNIMSMQGGKPEGHFKGVL